MAVDGRKVGTLRVRLWVKYENTRAGTAKYRKPAFVVHFYDSARRSIGEGVIGPWIGIEDWRQVSSEIDVPVKAREAVIRIGLNGATGRLAIDDVTLTPTTR